MSLTRRFDSSLRNSFSALATSAPFAHLTAVRILRALLILALLAAPARASLSSLMLFTGTLRGETNLTGLPPLTWIFSAAPAAENRKTALLALKAAGLDLRAHLSLDQSSGAALA